MKLTLKKKIGGAVTAVAVAAGAGIASAYWTSSGEGSGSASAGSDTAWVVATDAATGDPLAPGGPTQTVDFSVTNDGAGHQGLNEVEISVANPDGSPWSSGNCDADDFSVGGEAPGSSSVESHDPAVDLAPGQSHDSDVTVQMVNKTDASQDDCKGVTVPLHLSAS